MLWDSLQVQLCQPLIARVKMAEVRLLRKHRTRPLKSAPLTEQFHWRGTYMTAQGYTCARASDQASAQQTHSWPKSRPLNPQSRVDTPFTALNTCMLCANSEVKFLHFVRMRMSGDIPLEESFELNLVTQCLLRTIQKYPPVCPKSHKSPNLTSLLAQL